MNRMRSASSGTTIAELDRDGSIPYYLQIEERLRDLIESGDLAPLTRVPSEIELAAMFGVSRMTARKSVDRLVSEGFLFRRQGKGTFVASPRMPHPTSTQMSFSGAMKALNHTVTTEVLHAGSIRPSAHIARELRIAPDDHVIHIRRLRIVDGAPTALHTTVLSQRYSGVLSHDLTGSLTSAMEAEGAICATVRNWLEALVASEDLAELLDIERGAPLMRLESVGFAPSMEPVRYTDSLYRGDRFRFTSDGQGIVDFRVEVRDPAV